MEDFGKLMFIKKDWEMFVPYNLTEYFGEIDLLDEKVKEFHRAYLTISYKFGAAHEDNIKEQLDSYKNEI